jgi:hypothetical protein
MSHRAVLLLGSLTLGICGPAAAGGDKNQSGVDKRQAVGRMFSPVGTLLVQEASEKEWKHPQLFDDVYSGDRLLVLPGATGIVDLKEGDVHLTLAGNLPELSPVPVLECACVLHADSDFDLDVTLASGRLKVESRRKKGTLNLRFRLGKEKLDVVLFGPDSVVTLERYSRWPPGARLARKVQKGLEPENHVLLLIVKGKAAVHFQGDKQTQAAPIAYHWSSVSGLRAPIAVRQLPRWVMPGADPGPQATAWYAAVESVRKRLAAPKTLAEALNDAFTQKDPLQRSVAVFCGAAVGDVPLLLAGLNDAKSMEVRRAAVLSLQHYVGRSQAADRRLHDMLLQKKLSAGQAEIAMNLVHGFGGNDLARPETYETLINYLQHQQLAIRELAAWNLHELVPQGKKIAYDAAAPADQRARAQLAWRKLIPDGKLPPRTKS